MLLIGKAITTEAIRGATQMQRASGIKPEDLWADQLDHQNLWQ